MDIVILHIIAIGCIMYLSYRYGVYRTEKELQREMEEFLRRATKKHDPFFERR